jgi:hypothetical protein
MSALEILAEARIREWLSRPRAERERVEFSYDQTAPLELQLVTDVLALDRLAARASDDADRRDLEKRADALMLRALVLLERDGRPLAAQHFADRRREARAAARASFDDV